MMSERLARISHWVYISAPRTIPIPNDSRILLVAIARPIATTGGRRQNRRFHLRDLPDGAKDYLLTYELYGLCHDVGPWA